MAYVRLDYEPVVALAAAETQSLDAEVHVWMLGDARLTYIEGSTKITYVDVNASLMLFDEELDEKTVSVTVVRDGGHERLSGTIRLSDDGRILGILSTQDGDFVRLHARCLEPLVCPQPVVA